MKKRVGLAALLLVACQSVGDGTQEGGANANDRSAGVDGERLETGAMALSPSGAYIVARRNTTTLVVDVHARKLIELDLLGERFVFSKTREVVYAMLANREGVVAIDLASGQELWRSVPAFSSSAGAYLARVTNDDRTLLVGDYDRILFIDPQDGDVEGAAKVGPRPVDLEILPDGKHALVVGSTTWADGGPHTPVSLVPLAEESRATVATIDVPNCAAPIAVAQGARRAMLSPTFCTPDADGKAKGWSNPDPVSMIDIDQTAGTLRFLKNLPGFGPVAMLADGHAVAYLDMKRIDRSMFDDPSQIPSASGPQFHLMTIEPASMTFALHPIGASLPRFAPTKDGKALLVDASVAIVRNEVSASVSIDSNGRIAAEVSGAFGDTSGSLFGAFDLATQSYVPFAGPAAALDRFVQVDGGSRVFTLRDNGRGGDLFFVDVTGHASFDLGRSVRDIAVLPDGRTLVLRVRLDATAEGHLRERFCLSPDGVTCSASIDFQSKVPERD